DTRPYDTRTGTVAPPGTRYYRPNTKDFGPRLALAWQINPKTVVRTGYGIFWQSYPIFYGSFIGVNLLPGNTSLVRANVPDLSYPIANFVSQGAPVLPSVAGFDWNRRDTYSQQWNFTIEREIASQTSAQIAYVGNRGLNLARPYTINFFDPTLGRRPNPTF